MDTILLKEGHLAPSTLVNLFVFPLHRRFTIMDTILLKEGHLQEGMDQLAKSEARVVLLYSTKAEAQVRGNFFLFQYHSFKYYYLDRLGL